jgi:signal transduction histidine kinase
MPDPAELKSRRMDLVARWADDLAHEIKNPLHAMVINLELVKRRAAAADPEPLVERVQVVEAELLRVHSLIESLLRLIRPWPDNGFTQVERIFQDFLPVFRARAAIRRIEFHHEDCAAAAAITPDRLTLVLLLLVDRAIEATAAEGSIRTACAVDGDWVRISVGATPPESAGEEPAATRSSEPWNPGFATELAREAEGDLTVRDRPGGQGFTASVLLPRADTA